MCWFPSTNLDLRLSPVYRNEFEGLEKLDERTTAEYKKHKWRPTTYRASQNIRPVISTAATQTQSKASGKMCWFPSTNLDQRLSPAYRNELECLEKLDERTTAEYKKHKRQPTTATTQTQTKAHGPPRTGRYRMLQQRNSEIETWSPFKRGQEYGHPYIITFVQYAQPFLLSSVVFSMN